MSGLTIYTQKFVTVKEISIREGVLSADLFPEWPIEEPQTGKITDEVTYTYPKNTIAASTAISNFEEAEKISFSIQEALTLQSKPKKVYSFSVLEEVLEDEFSSEKTDELGLSLLRPSTPAPDVDEDEPPIRSGSPVREFEGWQELQSYLIQPSGTRQAECSIFPVLEEVTEEEFSPEKTEEVGLSLLRPSTPTPDVDEDEPPIRLGSPGLEFANYEEVESYFIQASGTRQRVKYPY